MRLDGTKKKPATPTPSKKYPVSRATAVMSLDIHSERVMVLAARMGPRLVAKMAVMERMKVMRSRFHSGQLRGSLGSSDG